MTKSCVRHLSLIQLRVRPGTYTDGLLADQTFEAQLAGVLQDLLRGYPRGLR